MQVAGEAVVGGARSERGEGEQDFAAVELASGAASATATMAAGALAAVDLGPFVGETFGSGGRVLFLRVSAAST
ncbi:MAG: hypothetical protein EBY49_06820 [Actinobacteria bacterium]|nr:hypothetical protein [Actinomycetota bacterium]